MKIEQVPKVGLIWAQSVNKFIGKDGGIPGEFFNDLPYFRSITLGSTVIMGRKTWESLPFKPLVGRVNVVLTSDKDYQVPEGVKVIQSLEELEVTTSSVFFIGGKAVYELGFPYATEIHITHNTVAVEGDVRAPELPGFNPDNWHPVSHDCVTDNGKAAVIQVFQRKGVK